MQHFLSYTGRLLIGAIPMLTVIVLVGSVAFAVPLLRGHGAMTATPTAVPIVLVRDQAAGIDRVTLPIEKLFAFDSSHVDDGVLDEKTGRPLLEAHASRLKAAGVRQVVVVGHADRIGAISAIGERSQQRADAVRSALIKAGIDRRMIVAVGVGNRLPITGPECDNTKGAAAEACLAPDRRVDIWARVPGLPRAASTPG